VTQEPPPGAVEPPQSRERRAFHIFINYRREDTAGHAGRLYDALAARFGDDHVFMDIDAIDPGEDFTQVVEQSVGSCDVLLALIGRSWTSTVDREGRRRLDKPNDWVRVEIQTALDRADTRVIPTLVQGAEMPSSDDLPPPLQKLSHRNAFEIRDNRWRSDVQRLIEDLEELARTRVPAREALGRLPAWARSRWFVIGVVGVVLLVAAVLATMLLTGGSSSDDRAVSRYVGLVDARLTSSAHSKGDLNDLIGDVRRKQASRESALAGIDTIIRQRQALLDDLEPFDVPSDFRQTHDLLRTSVTSSLADDQAVKRWLRAFYNGTPDEPKLFDEVGRLSTIASGQKKQFLAEYNELRARKLDLAPTNPDY
jgi:TIR domain-containing protein